MTKQQEPYESRDSRTDLWGPRGEIPLGYPALKPYLYTQLFPQGV